MVKMVRKHDLVPIEWCFLVTAASPVVTAVMVAFTTVESSERYYFMWIFAMAFAVTLGLEQIGRRRQDYSTLHFHFFGLVLVMVPLLVVLYNFWYVYVPILKAQEPTPSEALEVVRYLEDQGYTEAYSTFESSNMMTALSNGKVNVYALNSFDSMDMCQWLTSTEWYPEDGIADETGTVYVVPDMRLEELASLQEKGITYECLSKIGTYQIVQIGE